VSSEPAGRDQPALIPLLAGFPLTRCGPRFSFPVSLPANEQKHFALTSSPLFPLLGFRCRLFPGRRLFGCEAALQRVH